MTPLEIFRRLGGSGDGPARLGSRHGSLLILGGGRTVWDDFARVRPWGGEIMAVNDIGAHLHDRVDHWVTLHFEYLPGWRTYRRRHCYGEGFMPVCHSHRVAEGVDVAWELGNVGGTSGLFASYIGLMLGYERIVLGGMPMTNDGHYFDPPWVGTDFADRATQLCWEQARDEIFEGRVQSLSGRTRDWLARA